MPKNIIENEDAELDAAVDQALAELEAEYGIDDLDEEDELDEGLSAPGNPGTPENVPVGKHEQDSVDSVRKASNATKKAPKRRADKDQGDTKAPGPLANSFEMPKTKAAMINAALELMRSTPKAELEERFASLINALDGEVIEEEKSKEAKNADMKKSNGEKAMRKLQKEDLNLAEDVELMLGDNKDLSEEFKKNVQTVFEAAVLTRVNEKLAQISEEIEQEAQASYETFTEELTEKVDQYLDYVVEEWMTENRIGVERGIRAEIVEDFVAGLRNLFIENNIDIPESKVNVVDELTLKVEQMQESIDELLEQKRELSEEVTSFKSKEILAEAAKDLSENQAAKLTELAESITFTTPEEFTAKVATLKKTYFSETKNTQTDPESEVTVLAEANQQKPAARPADPLVASVFDTITRLSPKNRGA